MQEAAHRGRVRLVFLPTYGPRRVQRTGAQLATAVYRAAVRRATHQADLVDAPAAGVGDVRLAVHTSADAGRPTVDRAVDHRRHHQRAQYGSSGSAPIPFAGRAAVDVDLAA